MTCLKHMQTYSYGEHCIYCGSPFKVAISSVSTESKQMTEKEYMELYHKVKGKRKYTKVKEEQNDKE